MVDTVMGETYPLLLGVIILIVIVNWRTSLYLEYLSQRRKQQRTADASAVAATVKANADATAKAYATSKAKADAVTKAKATASAAKQRTATAATDATPRDVWMDVSVKTEFVFGLLGSYWFPKRLYVSRNGFRLGCGKDRHAISTKNYKERIGKKQFRIDIMNEIGDTMKISFDSVADKDTFMSIINSAYPLHDAPDFPG
jgi:hypothetical protein